MTSRQSEGSRGARHPSALRRYAPEAAAVLWFGLFLVVLPIAFPAVAGSWLAAVLPLIALVIGVIGAAGFLVVLIDELHLAWRRRRARRRAGRRPGYVDRDLWRWLP